MKTKLKQTLTACALTTALLAGLMPCVSSAVLSASDFTDVKETDWFYSDLSTLVSRNIISGVSDTEFDPNGTLTLGQVLKMATAVRCIYEKGENTIKPTGTYSHWAEPYGSFANYWGIVNGVPAVEDYDKVVTRSEMAEIFANVYPDQTTFTANVINDFSEAPEQDVPDYVKMLYEAGILVGDDNGFRLGESVTRAEAVSIINRVRDTQVRVRLVPLEPVEYEKPHAQKLETGNTEEELWARAEEMLYYVNIEREKAGVGLLELDEEMTRAAIKRAEELIEIEMGGTAFSELIVKTGVSGKELSHSRPGSSGYDAITVYGDLGLAKPGRFGENCAMGDKTVEAMVKGWASSPFGHRENMLDPQWTKLGAGTVWGSRVTYGSKQSPITIVTECLYGVQHFSK